jgi:hypothetical protein
MPSNFPASADSFSNPNPLSSLDSPSHALQHTNANDAIEAVETYLINNTFTSPTFLETPVAPTAPADTNTTQIATTAFVIGQKSTTTPVAADVTGTVGTGSKFALSNHRHPFDTDHQTIDNFTTLANGTTAMTFGTNRNIQVTPTATATFTVSTGVNEGILTFLRILTSGTTSYTITFGSGFRTQGTLATGTTTGRTFMLTFITIDGTMTEISRTATMA